MRGRSGGTFFDFLGVIFGASELVRLVYTVSILHVEWDFSYRYGSWCFYQVLRAFYNRSISLRTIPRVRLVM